MLHSQRRIIALCTDFGLKDSYVAQMKGVILSLAPEVKLIDLSHEISPHDVLEAARFLETSVPFYPADTIFLAVVDPGVGGKRRRIIVEAEFGADSGQGVKRVFFVGPDNGIFSLAAPKEKRISVRDIQDFSRIPALPAARTFDGRNVFSPVAALIALGTEPAAFGPEIESRATLPQILEIKAHMCELLEGGSTNGEVVSVDQFGNCITNIKTELRDFSLSLSGRPRILDSSCYMLCGNSPGGG